MRRRALIVAFASALAIGLGGCSSETPGNASPGETTEGGSVPSFPEDTSTGEESTEPSEGDSGTIDLRPCELLSTEDLTSLGLPSDSMGGEDELGPGRSCKWQTSGSHLVGVVVMDDLSIDEVQAETPLEPVTIGSHDAVSYEGIGSTCGVSIAVTDSSRVDVVSVAGGDVPKACDYAKQAADLVEPKLP